MLTIFKNKFFYISFIIALIGFNYLFTSNVFSWFNLGIWTKEQNIKISKNYIRKTSTDNTALGVALANIKISKGDYNSDFYISKAVNYIKLGKSLIETDIIQLLDSSVDKSTIFESHVSQIDNLIGSIQDIQMELVNIIEEKRSLSVSCESEKTSADSLFSQGLDQNETDMILEGISNASDKGPCYIKNRILYNAYNLISQKLAFYEPILRSKYDILVNNKDMIIGNLEMFKDNYLDKLVELRDKISTSK